MTLIERLEALTGRDSLSNRMIADAIGIGPSEEWERKTSGNGVVYMDEDCWTSPCGTRSRRAPNYTGSIDAAMTLVPETHCWNVTDRRGILGIKPNAQCWTAAERSTVHGDATSPAIALCIAALKARQ